MRQFRFLTHSFALAIVFASVAFNATAQAQLAPDLAEKIDRVATDTLAKTGVPHPSPL